ncbi:hypothetical protein [Haloferula sp. BvORR071]|uniref:hypothetical protein n=1 Tax=Haloferula sp. BvORR071 TaxID=1396141 RepID=UPI000552DEF0|nr:hypothetical protein [Haloferula sp. BvORR071]
MSGKSCHSDLVFRLSCWGLGVIAFGQLLVGGVALAVRTEKAREVRVEERIVTKVVTIAAATPPVVAAAPPAPRPLLPPIAAAPEPVSLPRANPLAAPRIADPEVERLVVEARKARLASDNASAIIKLESAKEKAPEDPNVLYELGLLYEDMAAYDVRLAEQASDAYQAVFNLGTTGAGSLYELAAKKLEMGVDLPDAKRDELRLGRARIFRDDKFVNGERTVVTVPVQAEPGTQVGNDLDVQVEFFDSTVVNGKKQIVPCSPDCKTIPEWVSGEFNFDGGEESLRVTYILPSEDLQQQQLFGKRTYYGQVVKLFYKGELIDTQAWPRHLSAQGPVAAGKPQEEVYPEFLQTEDIVDPSQILLGPKSEPPPISPSEAKRLPAGVPPLPR